MIHVVSITPVIIINVKLSPFILIYTYSQRYILVKSANAQYSPQFSTNNLSWYYNVELNVDSLVDANLLIQCRL